MYQALKRIESEQLVAVIRADDHKQAYQYVEACIRGGFNCIELTYTTPKVEKAIEQLKEQYPNILLGAGSVLEEVTAQSAIQAGADFVVSPGFNKEIAFKCNLEQVPYLPGCMTVTEMMSALSYGCSIIKLFPGSQFGPSAINQFKGPLPQVSIMPTGGVNLENINEWFEQGAFAVGIGGSLTQGSLEDIEAKARAFVEQVKES
ncbi:bifunctional 2-keto-4-hydroxyglutarate aldolase/2-keto-3-deoxy-6-phosphogluconate aldolase [Alkalibacillus haloalkaliphilus]|nr:bifunctional 2-keto-4-hydroxyglutarate aldolase/2-keto-3-deoxy-6-phosphogluconate aldolase [Alkalibacillus haloalkaliphilus]